MGLNFDSMVSCGRESRSSVLWVLRTLHVAGAVMLAFSMSGCSISKSISDSVSSPFEWSSDSSSGSSEEKKESYRHDIRNYTEVFARSNVDAAGFSKGLSSIAEKYGITNWEADKSTYLAIGEGLAKAKSSGIQVDAYKAALSQGDPVKIAAIQKGYEQAP